MTRKKLITNTCYFNYEKIYIYMAKNKLNLSQKKKTNKQTKFKGKRRKPDKWNSIAVKCSLKEMTLAFTYLKKFVPCFFDFFFFLNCDKRFADNSDNWLGPQCFDKEVNMFYLEDPSS